MRDRCAPTVILLYHRIACDGPDPHLQQVRPEHFAGHLGWLRSVATVVPLADVVRPAAEPRVAITFDDGYADNLHVAKPLLESFGQPATVFVTSSAVGSGRGFWYDRLASLMLEGEFTVSHLQLVIGGRRSLVYVGSPRARRRAHTFVHHRLRRRPAADIEAVLDTIAQFAGGRGAPPTARAMTADELCQLVEGGTVAVGAHTVTHPILATLDERGQRDELERGRVDLERLLGRPVPWFAYPFGDPTSFDATSVRLARELFDLAVTTAPGAASPADDPHVLPRVHVRDGTAETLAHSLAAWIKA